MGPTFYLGLPHLRVHYTNDYSEESGYHSDERNYPGRKLTLWSPMLNPKDTQFLRIIPNLSAFMLRVIGNSRPLMDFVSSDIHLNRNQSILFDASTLHRGSRNRYNPFFSKVTRITQAPFPEQGYKKITIDEGNVRIVEKKNFPVICSEVDYQRVFSSLEKDLGQWMSNPVDFGDSYLLGRIADIDFDTQPSNEDIIKAIALGEFASYYRGDSNISARLVLESFLLNPKSGFIVNSLLKLITTDFGKLSLCKLLIDLKSPETLITALESGIVPNELMSEMRSLAVVIDSNYA
jgi:hypothetical protein